MIQFLVSTIITYAPARTSHLRCVIICALSCLVLGCTESPQGEGPGRREQPLALEPEQELEIGRQAAREILSHMHIVEHGSDVDRVKRVSRRIAQTVKIEPLMREIHLRVKDYAFEWEYYVVQGREVNAFCLPGGKIVVFTGLLEFVQNDDQLATVISHEVAHALAHHASERLARQQTVGNGLLRLSYDREQELEADHIGVFLLTFAGYDPHEGVAFWQRMQTMRRQSVKLPELLSSHPNDERRMQNLEGWGTTALAAKEAYDTGRISPVSSSQ